MKGYDVAQSTGSKKRQTFTDASGGELVNEGEIVAQLIDTSDPKHPAEIASTFQITKVTRPLWSISKILDNLGEDDAKVVFKRKEAYVINSKGVVLARAERRGGFYIGTLQLKNPRHRDFPRQGR